MKNQSAYNENSIFAGMETDKFTVLHYTFVADGDYAQICPAYASALRDSNTVDILRKNLSDEFKGADEEYIRELILVSGEGAVDLMIVIPEGTNEAALASAPKEAKKSTRRSSKKAAAPAEPKEEVAAAE